MALTGGTHNSKGKTVKNTKLKSTGGSIAKNNTNFRKGAIGSTPGLPQKSKGEVITNPQSDKLHSTGRPKGGAMKQGNKLPSGMTQQTSKKIPIGTNIYGQSSKSVRTMRGGNDSTTVANLKKYIAKKEQGLVR